MYSVMVGPSRTPHSPPPPLQLPLVYEAPPARLPLPLALKPSCRRFASCLSRSLSWRLSASVSEPIQRSCSFSRPSDRLCCCCLACRIEGEKTGVTGRARRERSVWRHTRDLPSTVRSAAPVHGHEQPNSKGRQQQLLVPGPHPSSPLPLPHAGRCLPPRPPGVLPGPPGRKFRSRGGAPA